jgi:hypothetical protein
MKGLALNNSNVKKAVKFIFKKFFLMNFTSVMVLLIESNIE